MEPTRHPVKGETIRKPMLAPERTLATPSFRTPALGPLSKSTPLLAPTPAPTPRPPTPRAVIFPPRISAGDLGPKTHAGGDLVLSGAA